MRLLPSLFAVIASACLGAPSPGYLALLGPNPIRFQPPPQATLTRVSLPPLQMREVKGPVVTNTEPELPAAAGTPIPPALPMPLAPSSTNQLAGLTNQPSAPGHFTPFPTEPTMPAEAIPQLLHFFNQMPMSHGGNGSSTVVPINFVPAIPNNPPPSSATYSSPVEPAKTSP